VSIRQVVTAVIEREDRRILIGQRRRADSSPLKWEFPGGKVKTGESLEQALSRELREELDVTLLRAVPISRVEHAYGDNMGSLSIIFFAVAILESELRPGPFEQVAWVLPRELRQYDFLIANHRLIAELATGRIKPAELLASVPSDSLPDPHRDSH
jgi:8-oxo-dGTP diphosphatase